MIKSLFFILATVLSINYSINIAFASEICTPPSKSKEWVIKEVPNDLGRQTNTSWTVTEMGHAASIEFDKAYVRWWNARPGKIPTSLTDDLSTVLVLSDGSRIRIIYTIKECGILYFDLAKSTFKKLIEDSSGI